MNETVSNPPSEFGTYGYGTFQDNVRELARLDRQAEVAWQVEKEALVRHGLGPHSQVLDVACGAGALTWKIAESLQGGSVLGVDLCDLLLSKAGERKVASVASQVKFQQGNVYDLDVKRQFDFAYARFLFQHLERPAAALQSIRDSLRPGGRLLVVDVDDRDLSCMPGNDDFSRFLSEAARNQKQGGGNRMIGRVLPSLFEKAGLTDVRHETVRFDSDQMGLDQFLELTTTFKREQFAPEDRAKADRLLCSAIAQIRRERARLTIDIHCVSGAR